MRMFSRFDSIAAFPFFLLIEGNHWRRHSLMRQKEKHVDENRGNGISTLSLVSLSLVSDELSLCFSLACRRVLFLLLSYIQFLSLLFHSMQRGQNTQDNNFDSYSLTLLLLLTDSEHILTLVTLRRGAKEKKPAYIR